jgi:P-type E1-E2 ATPase
MLELEIPGFGNLRLHHLVLDVNGTIALDGAVLPGLDARLARLKQVVSVHLLSADTRGTAARTAAGLGISLLCLEAGPEAEAKARAVADLGAEGVVAVGNGANDADMLAAARLGIAVLGDEGLGAAALRSADVVVGSIQDALDLLLHPPRLVATLRR